MVTPMDRHAKVFYSVKPTWKSELVLGVPNADLSRVKTTPGMFSFVALSCILRNGFEGK